MGRRGPSLEAQWKLRGRSVEGAVRGLFPSLGGRPSRSQGCRVGELDTVHSDGVSLLPS